jgi:hypothetical protein
MRKNINSEKISGDKTSIFDLLKADFRLPAFVALFFFALFLSSCEDVIDVKLSDEDLNLKGVEAYITTNDNPSVFLYQTLKVNQDQAYPGISGAEVVISDDATPSNLITLTENQDRKGYYEVPENLSYPGIAGREYTLTIKTDGVTIIAKDRLSSVEPIDSIQVVPSQRGEKRFLGIFTYGKETPGIGDYYKWDIYVNDSLLYNADRLAIASDEYVDGNYISKLEIFTDFYDINKPEDRILKLNDTIQVKQTSISESAYSFYFQMLNQSATGSLFSVPPANIRSTITSSDGKPVLGIFSARDISGSNKVVINQKIEDQLKK